MALNYILKWLRKLRIILVVRTSTLEIVETAIEWLTDEGFRTFEITLRILDTFELINLCAWRRNSFLYRTGLAKYPCASIVLHVLERKIPLHPKYNHDCGLLNLLRQLHFLEFLIEHLYGPISILQRHHQKV